MSSKTFKANEPHAKPHASMSPAAWLNGLLNYYYAWVAAVIAIMATIVSALAGHLRL
jgi:hypothetical protein